MRGEVLWFAAKMEEKLKENDHKGGWDDCSFSYLLRRLHEEVIELHVAVNEGRNANACAREAADVANFAMMIADLVKTNEQQ